MPTATFQASKEYIGRLFAIQGTCEGDWTNEGYGDYECHGYRGVHNDWQFNPTGITDGVVSWQGVFGEVQASVEEFKERIPHLFEQMEEDFCGDPDAWKTYTVSCDDLGGDEPDEY